MRDAILDSDSSGAWEQVQVESLVELFFSGNHNTIRLLKKKEVSEESTR